VKISSLFLFQWNKEGGKGGIHILPPGGEVLSIPHSMKKKGKGEKTGGPLSSGSITMRKKKKKKGGMFLSSSLKYQKKKEKNKGELTVPAEREEKGGGRRNFTFPFCNIERDEGREKEGGGSQ